MGRCPILGDRRYGGPTTITLTDGRVLEARHVMLHAERLELRRPDGAGLIVVEAPLPKDYASLLEDLGGLPRAGR